MPTADDVLTYRTNFDPSGMQRGVAAATATLAQFETAVRKVAVELPDLSAHELASVLAPEFRKAAAEADKLSQKVRAATAEFARMEAAQVRFRDPDSGRFISRATVELRTLSTQLQQSQVVANQFTGAMSRMNMATLGRSSGPIGDNGASMQRGLDSIAASAGRANGALRQVGHSSSQTMQHFVTVAAAALGADTALARMSSTMLAMSVGFKRILIAAGVIFAVAKAYELLTERTREATKARNELIKAGEQRLKGAEPETTTLSREISATTEAVGLLEKKLDRIRTLVAASGQELRAGGNVANELAEKRRQLEELTGILQRQNANRMLAAQREIAAAQASTIKAAIEQAAAIAHIQSEIAAQGPQTFGAQPGLVSQQEATAFERRIALTRQATAADLVALRVQLGFAKSIQAAGTVEQEEKRKSIALIEEAIRAREQEGQAAVQIVREEQRLLEATRARALLEQAHANRVLAAGGGNLLGANPQVALTLPTDTDIARLTAQLQTIPPVGIPTPEQIRQAWDDAAKQARTQALPPVLQPPRRIIGDPANPFVDMVQDIRKAKAEALEFARAEKEARTEGERMRDTLLSIGQGAKVFADVGRSLGFISDQAANAISAVGDLADSLAAVAANASLGNILGAVGAAGSVLGGLFGESATAREHAAIVERNNERLLDLKLSLDQLSFSSPLAGRAGDVFGVDLSKTHTGGQAELDAALAEAGLTLEEFAATVERLTGAEILDSEGKLIPKAWRQARENFERAAAAYNAAIDAENLKRAQEQHAEAMGKLRQAAIDAAAALEALEQESINAWSAAIPTLQDISRRTDTTFATGTPGDLQQRFMDSLRGIDTATSGFVESFKDFDLTDPAQREELRKKVKEWADGLLSGNIELQDISQLDDFTTFLGGAVDILDEFDKAAEDATKAMLNMPRGINLAAIEFRAQAVGAKAIRDTVLQRGRAVAPASPSLRNGGGSGFAETGGPGSVIKEMVVHIHTQPDQDPNAIANAVDRIVRRKNMRKVGSPNGLN